ncbi:ribonuclease HII [Zhengella mangrovi]|uniref:Ribonuclease HII n=1 Tax=Zhengella mangrovi TaxID=1982044 RepID=A0A2G1QNR0_9HYPH|nr:ribonuclease HII [Zhengella mangrovi]PHP67166.1 ribonuclease HII [Zhengella mangrovi]
MARTSSDSPLLFDMIPPLPDFTVETGLIRDGLGPVAGLDEAGRGPLAGPVVAAAVVLDPADLPEGLDDSKRLKAGQREALMQDILARAIATSIVSVCAESIDRTDIRKASLSAMTRAVRALSVTPGYALADGRDVPPGLPCPARALVKGDQRSMSIAAASILAKVTRDRMMARACPSHPVYGFSIHSGYATRRHRDAITAHGGVVRLHRFSFAPLKPR